MVAMEEGGGRCVPLRPCNTGGSTGALGAIWASAGEACRQFRLSGF